MINMTTALISMQLRRRDKWGSETEAFFRKAAAAVAGKIEWDSDAGEDWARVFDSSDELVAYLYALAPLVICLDHDLMAKALPTDSAVVQVDDFDSAELTAEPAAISALFGRDVMDGELCPEAFSAADLWFSTV